MSPIREFKINTNYNLSEAIYLLNPLIFFLDITILKAADFLSKIKRKRSNSVVKPKNPPSPNVVYHSRRESLAQREPSRRKFTRQQRRMMKNVLLEIFDESAEESTSASATRA